MQHAAPPAGTAIRELSRIVEESEGHVLEVAASFVTQRTALAEPKVSNSLIPLMPICKFMKNIGLMRGC